MGLMGAAHFRVCWSTGCSCWAGHDSHSVFEMVRVSTESLPVCRKRLANTNSYSVFIVASVITLPKGSDICFLWLTGVIFVLRSQFFIRKPLAEEWMLLVLFWGEQGGLLWQLLYFQLIWVSGLRVKYSWQTAQVTISSWHSCLPRA